MMATLLAALMCLPGRHTNFPVADRDKWAPPEPCGASQTLNRIATNYTRGILYSLSLSLSLVTIAGLKDPNLDRHATKGKNVERMYVL